MSKTKEIIKVPFYGQELITVEKAGRQYVAMKPIAEALGLKWNAQYELILRDPVLCKKGIRVKGVPSKGGPQEMFCLPLEYLNGWLFKVPANRYAGKRQEVIIRYQRECYQTLYDYFHNGGALNQNADQDQLAGLLKKMASMTAVAVSEAMGEKIFGIAQELKNFEKKIIELHMENDLLKEFCPKGEPGEISKITDLPKDRFVRGYFTSNRSGTPVANLYIQLELPLMF